LRKTAKQACLLADVIEIDDPSEALRAVRFGLPVIGSPCPDCETGTPSTDTAASIVRSVEDCVADVWSGKSGAVVTNPISKSLLNAAGFQHPGHTEFLAELAGKHSDAPAPLPVMMLVGGGLRVALTTIHMPLMTVGAALTSDLIFETGAIVADALKQDFGISAPRIGVCGLNPHAGEDGILGSEDAQIITPAITRLNAGGMSATGPRPGDTIFHESLRGMYDAVLAMYHDQGLIPVKTLDMWGGVNVTLGLPFIRTSPDHGTAYDAAANGSARPDSLIAAMKLAREMSACRSNYRATA
jgi:4-hydroxythreonine-4-phosphate dehydrogenase